MSDPALNQGKPEDPDKPAPAISKTTANAISAAFAILIVGGMFAALAMLIGWGLVELWGWLFG